MLLDTTSQAELTAQVRQTPRESAMLTVWASPGRFALFLGLLVCLTFPSVLFGSQAFAFRDFGLFGYPLAFFHRQSFWRGELPLWDPLNHCGLPFLAQWNTMTLYPGSLIYLLLPLPWSLSFFCLAHLFWGGLGTYLVTNEWTKNRLAAALAGVIFAFNGVMLGSLIWPSQIATFAWVPWTLWLVQLAWRKGGRWLIWGVVGGAMQMLAGGPETILLTWCLLCALALGDLIHRPDLRKRLLIRFCGTGLLVAAVCAAQLLPFLELVAQSQRDSGYAHATWSMPSWGWANFLVPLFRTFECTWGVYMQKNQLWLSSYYLGLGTLFLSAVALRRVPDLQIRSLAGLAVLAVILAMGENTPVYRALCACFPAIGFARFPVKFVIIASVVAPFLAAYGLKALSEQKRKPGRFEICCLTSLLLLIGVVILMAWNDPAENWRTTVRSGLSRGAILVLLVVLFNRFLASDERRQVVWGTLMLAVFWLDFLTHMPSQNPTIAPAVYSPDWVKAGRNWKTEPRIGQARAMISPEAHHGLMSNSITNLENNYLVYRLALFMDCNLVESIPQTHGFFALTPKRTDVVAAAPFVLTNKNYSALFDFMGVTELLGTNAPDWTPRTTAMPWVTIGQKPVCGDDALPFQAFGQTNMDFRNIVFLPTEANRQISATHQPTAKVVSSNFSDQKVWIQTDAPSASMVVISQSYHSAWKAYVDGRPTKLWRANYAFQAVQVPAGRHQVELRYEDNVFQAGVLLSALGITACIALWFMARRPPLPAA